MILFRGPIEKVSGGMIPPPGTLKNEKGHYIFVAKHVMSFHFFVFNYTDIIKKLNLKPISP